LTAVPADVVPQPVCWSLAEYFFMGSVIRSFANLIAIGEVDLFYAAQIGRSRCCR
jgi:hypothetical protein